MRLRRPFCYHCCLLPLLPTGHVLSPLALLSYSTQLYSIPLHLEQTQISLQARKATEQHLVSHLNWLEREARNRKICGSDLLDLPQKAHWARNIAFVSSNTAKTVCPSGLRGWTQVPLAQAAWAQIPQLSCFFAHGLYNHCAIAGFRYRGSRKGVQQRIEVALCFGIGTTQR